MRLLGGKSQLNFLFKNSFLDNAGFRGALKQEIIHCKKQLLIDFMVLLGMMASKSFIMHFLQKLIEESGSIKFEENIRSFRFLLAGISNISCDAVSSNLSVANSK